MRHYTVADGLPSNKVYQVLQDPDGILWFATESGLSRFDGVEWTNFSAKDGLHGQDVLNMLLDSRGRLWLANSKGVVEYYQDGEFHNAYNDPALEDGLSKDPFLQVAEDRKGRIWFSSHRKVFCIPPDDKLFLVSALSNHGNAGNLFFYLDDNGELLLSQRSGRSYRTESEDFLLTPMTLFNSTVFRLAQSKDGKLYAGWEYGMAVFHHNQLIRQLPLPVKKGILHLQVNHKEELILGTWEGIHIFSPEDSLFESPQTLLPGHSATYLLQDRESNQWITTLDDGVFMIPNSPSKFFTAREGFPEMEPTALGMDRNNRLWVGYDEGKAGYVEKGIYHPIDLKIPPHPQQNRCHTIIPARGDTLVFAFERYMALWDGNQTIPIYLPSKNIYSAPDGRILLSYYSNLFRFRNCLDMMRYTEMTREQKRKSNEQYGFPITLRSRLITRSPNDEVFTASFHGIFRIEGDTLIPSSPPIETPYLSFLPDGSHIVSTNGYGLLLMLPDTNLYVGEEQGLSGSFCTIATPINDHQIWVGTTRGLDKVELLPCRRTLGTNFLSGNVDDILVTGDTCWVATGNGLAMIQGNNQPDYVAPPPILTRILVNNAPTDLIHKHKLVYTQNNLEFAWATQYYQDPGKVRYRFRLKGYEEEWRYSRKTEVAYSNIEPGDYYLELAASLDGRRWTNALAEPFFKIKGPIWKDPWLQGSVALALLLLGIVAYRRRIRVINQRSQLEAESLKQKEIALRAQMNPHFVFNAMNSIQQYILLDNQDGALTYLSKFSKLIRRILENSRQAVIPMEQELEALRLYLELEKLRVGEKFHYEIEVDPELEPDFVVFPGLVLQPLAENAIWHGILPNKQKKGNLVVKVMQVGDDIVAEVDDNGVGRKASRKAQSADLRSDKTSMGMENIRDRLRIFGQTHGKEVEMKIEDKHDAAGQPAGTRVILQFPYSEING